MAIKKGQILNPEGRKPGTVNRSTGAIRTAFQNLVENNLPKLQTDLDQLEPKDRLTMIIKLSEFILPKLQSLNIENQLEIEYKQLEKLLLNAEPEAINLITQKIQTLKIQADGKE